MVNESTVVIPLAEENNIIKKKKKKDHTPKKGYFATGPNRTARITPTLSSGNLQRNHGENKKSKHTRPTTRSPPVGPTSPLPSLFSTRLDSTRRPTSPPTRNSTKQTKNPKSPTPNSEFPPKSLAARRFSPAETRFSKEFWFPEAEQAENRLVFLLGWGRG